MVDRYNRKLMMMVSDLDRRIVQVEQTIPVAQAGPLTLLYPKYLPGNHAATGRIIAGSPV